MDNLPRISEAEWVVMKIIWQKGSCTANDVVEALKYDKEWNARTIKTYISRLMNKKVIGYIQEGKNYIYYPLVEEQDCVQGESKSFLERFFDGSLKTMLVNFMDSDSLSEEEIDDLKRILDERK